MTAQPTPRAKATPKRKRRESFGQVRTLPSGRIQASYMGPDGLRHNASMTFDTTTDARGWLAKRRVELDDKAWTPTGAKAQAKKRAKAAETFLEYALRWTETRVNRDGAFLRTSTKAEYVRLINGPLNSLGSKQLSFITPEMVRTWNAENVATGRKTQTARAYGILNAVMKTAVEDRRIDFNPCIIRGAQNGSTGKKVEPPTKDELQIVVEAIAPKYKALILLAAWNAMRFGELTELRRKDVSLSYDADGGLDLITMSISRGVTHSRAKGFEVGEPKTKAAIRRVVTPPHINAQIMEHLNTFVAPGDEALLFPSAGGNNHLAQSTVAKAWYPARAKAGRHDLPFHGLRHFGGTEYAKTNPTLRELMDRLGHVDERAALRYQHSTGRDADFARKMSDMA
jgi:integrase